MKTYKYIVLAALVLGMVACTQDDVTSQAPAKDVPITIQSAGVAELMTRAIYDGVIIGGVDEPVYMGVFIRGGSADKYNGQNVRTEHNGTDWNPIYTVLYEGVKSSQQIGAYIPYSKDLTDGNKLAVSTPADQSQTECTEYFYADYRDMAASKIDLEMQRLLAKVQLQVTWGTEYDENPVQNIQLLDIHDKGTWILPTSDVEFGESVADITPKQLTPDGSRYEALVLPYNYTSGVTMGITTSDNRYFEAAVNPTPEISFFEGGYAYTFKVKVGKDKVTVESITVEDWADGGTIEGGEAEEDEWPDGINIYTGEYQPATLNAEGAYEIANVGNLMWFNQQVTASDVDNTALNAVLTADVDLEGFKWAALGRSSDKPYMGTFDGRGHTISNLSRNAHSNEGSRESFAYYLGAEGVIKNVTFDNADIFCQGHAGANASAVVALRSAGTISCCVVSNARVQLGNYEYLSGIVGVNNGTIENCAVINTSLTRRFGHSHPSAPITHNNQGTVRNCFAYGCTQSAGNAANGGIVVSSSTVPANCYYYTTSSVSDAYGTAKTPAEFASATMAELLNADQENGPWEYVTGNDYPTLKK